mgnify:CR=1 FL=1
MIVFLFRSWSAGRDVSFDEAVKEGESAGFAGGAGHPPAYAGTNSSRAASPSVKSLGTGGVRGEGNLSEERFPSPLHVVFPNVPLQPEKPGGVVVQVGFQGGGLERLCTPALVALLEAAQGVGAGVERAVLQVAVGGLHIVAGIGPAGDIQVAGQASGRRWGSAWRRRACSAPAASRRARCRFSC